MMNSAHSFKQISEIITKIYQETLPIKDGRVADYIPQLAEVNPDLYGITLCSVTGEIFNIGDVEQEFCIQSCSKPLNYCLARSINKIEIHDHVGYEPSGRAFNSFVLNDKGLPHNPLINAGAIMVSSLIEPNKEPSYRFNTVKEFYQKMSGGIGKVGFDNAVFLSEKHHADRNISLAYYMRENGAFNGSPTPNQLHESLDLYFQCCSITLNCKSASTISATLANGGYCPITHQQVVPTNIIKDCLSLMYACGMYDFSGQFSFEIGLPAKSGVSGCLFLVVPNNFGICIWSPRLDHMGNSVRGVEFCKRFINKTNHYYHIFHNIVNREMVSCLETEGDEVLTQRLITAASKGDLSMVEQLNGKISLESSDYDGRTALHLAAAEGHNNIVQYLIEHGCNCNPKDRWGNTPYHEASKLSDSAKLRDLLQKSIISQENNTDLQLPTLEPDPTGDNN
jgi:glutaminase